MVVRKSHRERIIVVDGDEKIRKLISETLHAEGYSAFAVATGIDATTILRHTDIDLIITDISTDGISGIELLKQIRENKRDIQVVLLSSNDRVDAARDALRFGAYDYIPKPFDMPTLIDSVKNALLDQKLRREREALLTTLMVRDSELEKTVTELESKSDYLDSMVKNLSQALQLSHTISVKPFGKPMLMELTRGFSKLFGSIAWGFLDMADSPHNLNIFLSRPANPKLISQIRENVVAAYREIEFNETNDREIEERVIGQVDDKVAMGEFNQINLPMVASGRINGMVFMVTAGEVQHSRDMIELFSMLVNQLGTSIESRRLLEKTKKLAITDELTCLFNRRHLMNALELEFLRGERYGNPFCFGILDIDHFKRVNDTYGHLVGDKVLQGVADIMLRNTRRTDVIGRYGGEEFAFILTNTRIDGAFQYIEKIRKNIQRHRFAGPDLDIRITASIGLSEFIHGVTGDVEELIGHADAALYRAKESGRNRTCIGRRYRRFPAELDVEVAPTESGQPIRCRSKDISLGGMMILTPVQFNVSDRVELNITLIGEEESIRCRGTVKYCINRDDAEGGSKYGIGVSIEDVSDDVRDQIARFIEQHLRQPQKTMQKDLGG